MAVNELFFERYPDAQLPHQIQVRPYNAEKTVNMRLLNPEGEVSLYTILSTDDAYEHNGIPWNRCLTDHLAWKSLEWLLVNTRKIKY